MFGNSVPLIKEKEASSVMTRDPLNPSRRYTSQFLFFLLMIGSFFPTAYAGHSFPSHPEKESFHFYGAWVAFLKVYSRRFNYRKSSAHCLASKVHSAILGAMNWSNQDW